MLVVRSVRASSGLGELSRDGVGDPRAPGGSRNSVSTTHGREQDPVRLTVTEVGDGHPKTPTEGPERPPDTTLQESSREERSRPSPQWARRSGAHQGPWSTAGANHPCRPRFIGWRARYVSPGWVLPTLRPREGRPCVSREYAPVPAAADRPHRRRAGGKAPRPSAPAVCAGCRGRS